MTREQQEEFKQLALPLIEWLNKHGNPHAKIIIDTTSVELVHGVMSVYTDRFVQD